MEVGNIFFICLQLIDLTCVHIYQVIPEEYLEWLPTVNFRKISTVPEEIRRSCIKKNGAIFTTTINDISYKKMFYSACRDGCCVCCYQNLKPCMPGSKGAISGPLDNGFDRFSCATCGSSCFSWGCLLAATWLINVIFAIYQRFVFHIVIGLPWFLISQGGKWLHHRWCAMWFFMGFMGLLT